MESVKKFFQNKFVPFGLLLVIGFLFFGNVINGPFILDDFSLIVDNESIKSFANFTEWFTNDRLHLTDFQSNFYRPISALTHASIFAFFGLNTAAYHIFNILAHIGGAMCIFVLFQRLSFKRVTAFLAALFFMLHPVQVESVSYISGTSDVLSGFFILFGLMIFSGNRKNLWSVLGVLSCAILGMMTKESAIIFFPLAILITVYKSGDKVSEKKGMEASKDLKILGTLFGITVLYVILKLTVFNFTDNIGLGTLDTEYSQSLYIRLVSFVSILFEYVKLMFYPVHLYFIKSQEAFMSLLTLKGAFGLLILIVGFISALFSYKKDRKIFFGYLWFFLSLIPVAGFIPLNTIFGERFLYIPIVGVIFLLASAFEYFSNSSKASENSKISEKNFSVLISVSLVTILLLGVRTVDRNSDWKSNLSFYENELKYDTKSPRINNEVGVAYFEMKEFGKAVPYYEKALEAMPELSVAHFNLANSYMNLERTTDAIEQYYLTIKYSPDYKDAYAALFQVYKYATKEPDKAEQINQFVSRIKAGEKVTYEEFERIKGL